MKASIQVQSPAGFIVTLDIPEMENRHKLLEILPRFEEELIEAGYNPVGQAPTPAHPSGRGSFAASSLTATVDNGKAYWRVKGGEFQKFGVAIYPEVLEAAGLADANPLKPVDLAGWTAHYVVNDKGKPKKVVNLEPPPA